MGREQELLDAARCGNVVTIDKLISRRTTGTFLPITGLRKCVNLGCTDGNGDTPLHLAALNGQVDAVRILLRHDAPVNVVDEKACAPLHFAAWNGNTEICELLLNHQGGVVIAQINLQNSEGDTALHCAAQYGHYQTVSLLLQNKADPFIRNLKDESPLDLSAQYGRLEVVCELINSHPSLITLSATSPSILSPLHLASRFGHLQVVEVLINAGFDTNVARDTGTALHEAALFVKVDVVKLLVDKGVNPLVRNKKGQLALDILRSHGTQMSGEAEQYIQDRINSPTIGTPDSDKTIEDTINKQSSPVLSGSTLSPSPIPKPRKSRSKSGESSSSAKSDSEPPPRPQHHPSALDIYAQPCKVKKDHIVSPDPDAPPLPPRNTALLLSPGTPPDMTPPFVHVSEESTLSEPLPPPAASPAYFAMGSVKPHQEKKHPEKPPRKKPPSPMPTRKDLGTGASDTYGFSPDRHTTHSPVLHSSTSQDASHTSPSQTSQSRVAPGTTPDKAYGEGDYELMDSIETHIQASKSCDYYNIPENKSDIPTEHSSDTAQHHEHSSNDSSSNSHPSIDSSSSNTLTSESPIIPDASAECAQSYSQPLHSTHTEHSNRNSKQTKGEHSTHHTKGGNNMKSIPETICGVDHDDDIISTGCTTDRMNNNRCHVSGGSPVDDSAGVSLSDKESSPVNRTSRPPSLEVEVKMRNTMPHITGGSTPLTPTGYAQPPTPDFPPPSPKTALMGIEQRINMQMKRKSHDIETMTDASHLDTLLKDTMAVNGTNNNKKNLNSHGKNDDRGTEKGRHKTDVTGINHEHRMVDGTDNVSAAIPFKVSSDNGTFSDKDIKKRLFLENKVLEGNTESNGAGSIKCSKSNIVLTGGSDNVGASRVAPESGDLLIDDDQKPRPALGNISVEPVVETAHSNDGSSEVNVSVLSSSSSSSLVDRELSSDEANKAEPPENGGGSTNVIITTVAPPPLTPDMIVDLENFSGLLRGSQPGGSRNVLSQISNNVVIRRPKSSSANRKSAPSAIVSFDPLVEQDDDINTDKIMAAIDKAISSGTALEGKSKIDDGGGGFDDQEEWAKIAAVLATYGGRLSMMAGDNSYLEKQLQMMFTPNTASESAQSVSEWLESLGLGQYENTLIANGFDDLDFLAGCIVDDSDLKQIGISTPEHRTQILAAVHRLTPIHTINDANMPGSVLEWLQTLRLSEYCSTFLSHDYTSMERVRQLWELELTTVLDITTIGHRKRILASLGDRPTEGRTDRVDNQDWKAFHTEDSQNSSHSSLTDDLSLYRDYTKLRPLISDDGESNLSSQNSIAHCDSSEVDDLLTKKQSLDGCVHIRPPHLAHTMSPVKQWRHRPDKLIKGCCNYSARYMGSTLVRTLQATESTREGIAKIKKSTITLVKAPLITLSISYRGVKFIDAKTKNVVCEHEIGNIFCACQDSDHQHFFAYITKDLETSKHYCHVFTVPNAEFAREIILTLGEAFEIAYQMALQEKVGEDDETDGKSSPSDTDDGKSQTSKFSINTI